MKSGLHRRCAGIKPTIPKIFWSELESEREYIMSSPRPIRGIARGDIKLAGLLVGVAVHARHVFGHSLIGAQGFAVRNGIVRMAPRIKNELGKRVEAHQYLDIVLPLLDEVFNGLGFRLGKRLGSPINIRIRIGG